MIQLFTLGPADLRRDGTEVRSVLLQPKRLALLAYLATAPRPGFVTREALLALFWPESEPERARNALRQALHWLRRSLGEDVLVSRGEQELAVDPAALQCDAVAFDRALEESRPADALALYRGDFLHGLYVEDALGAERWVDERRDHYRRRAVEAAWSVATAEEGRGAPRAAALSGRRALELDPLDEAAAVRLAVLLERTGDPAAGADVLDVQARRLREELQVEPSDAPRELARRLRDAAAAPPLPAPSGPTGAPPVTTAIAVSAPRSVPASAAGAVPAPRGANPRRMIGVILLVTLLAAGGVWVARRAGSAEPAAAPSIAVLPFLNMSGDPDNEYFSDGMTEEILNALAQVRGLRVAARTSSFAFKGMSPDVRDVADRLGVATVLEGSVRRADGRVKVTAQLIDARTGYHLWSEAFDRELGEVFAIQEEISRAIVDALQPRLGATTPPSAEAARIDPAVYDLYLRGRYLTSTTVEEKDRRAIALFEDAIRRTPGFAPAHAGLARALIALSEFVPPRDVLPRAKQAALDALALDSTLVETRLALAAVRRVYDRDWAAAEREIRRAIALDPASAAAHAAYSDFLLDSRRFDEARRERERAWQLRRDHEPDPALAAFRAEEDLSWGSYFLRVHQYDDAIDRARSALELAPGTALAHWMIGFSHQRLGRDEDALAELERARQLAPGALPFLSNLGHAYARAGRREPALAVLDTLLALSETRYVPKDQIALVLFGLGDTARAFEWLERAVDDYHWWLPAANAHPVWDEVRGDPRFVALMRRLGAGG